MRKQFAAANWKMNCTYQQAEKLLNEVLQSEVNLSYGSEVIFAVPYPYLIMANSEVADEPNYSVAAQNCHQKKSGAYTGEVSAEMLRSLSIAFCVVGHSERREYFLENNQILAEKVNVCLEYGLSPIFCCGEPLGIRESGKQNEYVETQLIESLFHLNEEQLKRVIIAYEPIWAIGTGKTASTQQAQEMHAHLRSLLAKKYSPETADEISILYGGSVKANNAAELFACPDVDGGLVGGASLNAKEFIEIMKALK
jgi:triosephosphate isomerase